MYIIFIYYYLLYIIYIYIIFINKKFEIRVRVTVQWAGHFPCMWLTWVWSLPPHMVAHACQEWFLWAETIVSPEHCWALVLKQNTTNKYLHCHYHPWTSPDFLWNEVSDVKLVQHMKNNEIARCEKRRKKESDEEKREFSPLIFTV